MLAILSVLKFILLALIAALVVAIVVLFVKSLNLRPKFKVLPAFGFFRKLRLVDGKYSEAMRHREAICKKSEELRGKTKNKDERNLRLCIIEADNLVDEILIMHGHPGKDMAERLKAVFPEELQCLDELWGAHKVRNRIAHESDFHLSPELAQKTVDIYCKALDELTSKEMELV